MSSSLSRYRPESEDVDEHQCRRYRAGTKRRHSLASKSGRESENEKANEKRKSIFSACSTLSQAKYQEENYEVEEETKNMIIVVKAA